MSISHVDVMYGAGKISLAVPRTGDDLMVLNMPETAPLVDPELAIREALIAPRGTSPFTSTVTPGDRVTIVIPDATRPLPPIILRTLLAELRGASIPPSHITITNGLGGHEAETSESLRRRLGADTCASYGIAQSDAQIPADFVVMGETPAGRAFRLHESVARADFIILVGMCEPHLWAGFSGHYKALLPGVVDAETLLEYHCPNNVGHPKSTYLVTDGNPTFDFIQHCGLEVRRQKPVFLCNYTMDTQKNLTGFFAGDVGTAFDAARARVEADAKVECSRRYPMVVVTNGGYPADQNLYQSAKGLSAAKNLVEPGGLIALAAECCDGGPPGFLAQLRSFDSSRTLLRKLYECKGRALRHDQWIGQTFAEILASDVNVALFSSLPNRDVEDVLGGAITPIDELPAFVQTMLSGRYADQPVAIMPHGFYVIPQVV